MRKVTYLCLILPLWLLASCAPKQEATTRTGADSLPLSAIAETITYDVVVKNPNPEDTWITECLSGLDLPGFISLLFDLVYKGTIKPFDYHSGQPLSVEDVKMLEQDFPRTSIGKVQFTEGWYFEKEGLTMVKKVRSVMIAYELYDLEGKVNGYKAGFVVSLNP